MKLLKFTAIFVLGCGIAWAVLRTTSNIYFLSVAFGFIVTVLFAEIDKNESGTKR